MPFKEVKCFMDGLNGIGWKHNILYPGVISDGSHEFIEPGLTLKKIKVKHNNQLSYYIRNISLKSILESYRSIPN